MKPTSMRSLGYERKVKVGRRRIMRGDYVPTKRRRPQLDGISDENAEPSVDGNQVCKVESATQWKDMATVYHTYSAPLKLIYAFAKGSILASTIVSKVEQPMNDATMGRANFLNRKSPEFGASHQYGYMWSEPYIEPRRREYLSLH
ncbi:uncharacterized protein [Dermacentor albipictus]|uniref:uncharacterized protein isoform X1 n=1 Tax=Dermacentor albipictus TaxID=60249 RepID=UPI0038FC77F4